MIFKPELVEKILAGEKTETRRLVKGDECRYKVFRSYAVQPGRGEKQLCRIRIQDIQRERLGDIGEVSATREGFQSREEFLACWKHLYGKLDLEREVWAIRFQPIVPREKPEPGEADVIDFDREKHKRREGFAILIQGKLHDEIQSVALNERISVHQAISRAIKFYGFANKTRKRNGRIELVDHKGARWSVTGWEGW